MGASVSSIVGDFLREKRNLDDVWKKVDRDRSGYLDKDEFRKLMSGSVRHFLLESEHDSSPSEMDAAATRLCDMLHPRIDKDNDGKISREEFEKAGEELRQQYEIFLDKKAVQSFLQDPVYLDEVYRRIDKDNSGGLDKDEFKQMMQVVGERMASMLVKSIPNIPTSIPNQIRSMANCWWSELLPLFDTDSDGLISREELEGVRKYLCEQYTKYGGMELGGRSASI